MTKIDLTNAKELEVMATKNQCSYVAMLMQQLFGDNRKKMLVRYFGKKSTKDFTYEEIKLVIELLLNQKDSLMEFYNKMLYDDSQEI